MLTKLIDQFQTARRDTSRVVIEGVQALKHAVRFNAEIEQVVTDDVEVLNDLLSELAPDTIEYINERVTEVTPEAFQRLTPQPHRTRVVALAKRHNYSFKNINKNQPIVFLEQPRDLENIGAVIRVSAAADVAAVCITGPVDIWHPAVIRGAAGLHFAIPVYTVELNDLDKLERPLVALEPTGTELKLSKLPRNAVYIFGTERHGVSQQLLDKSNFKVRLPMKEGVSSLNLATSVAATLYSQK